MKTKCVTLRNNFFLGNESFRKWRLIRENHLSNSRKWIIKSEKKPRGIRDYWITSAQGLFISIYDVCMMETIGKNYKPKQSEKSQNSYKHRYEWCINENVFSSFFLSFFFSVSVFSLYKLILSHCFFCKIAFCQISLPNPRVPNLGGKLINYHIHVMGVI